MARLNASIPGVTLFVVLGVLAGTGTGFARAHAIDASVLNGPAEVDAFLKNHAAEAYDSAKLGDFRILDLDQDGRADLIATIDSSGRGFFNHLLVLHDNGEQLTVQEVDVWNMESLDGVVQDLDGDGHTQLLLRKSLTPYLGSRPMASWTAVFRLDGKKLVDQSTLYPQFYDAHILPEIDRGIAEASNTESSEDNYRRDALIIERDKILRALGRSLDAGLGLALRWASSADPVQRIFALAALSELEGSEAASALKTLGQDVDPEVSARARIADAARRAKMATP